MHTHLMFHNDEILCFWCSMLSHFLGGGHNTKRDTNFQNSTFGQLFATQRSRRAKMKIGKWLFWYRCRFFCLRRHVFSRLVLLSASASVLQSYVRHVFWSFPGHSLFVCVFFALARAHVWFVIRKVCFISRLAISHCANVSVVPVLQIATIMWM